MSTHNSRHKTRRPSSLLTPNHTVSKRSRGTNLFLADDALIDELAKRRRCTAAKVVRDFVHRSCGEWRALHTRTILPGHVGTALSFAALQQETLTAVGQVEADLSALLSHIIDAVSELNSISPKESS
jgi:hypothetical protein